MDNDKTKISELENKVSELEAKLTKQTKELNCISELSKLVETKDNIGDILTELTYVLKRNFQFPEITEVKITNENFCYQTENFKETKWTAYSDIFVDNQMVGRIYIAYLENRTNNTDPFLMEEYDLLNIITEHLGKIMKLLEKSDIYSELFETLYEGIIKTDKNGIITEANNEALKIYGSNNLSELIGKSISELFANPEIHLGVIEEMKKQGGRLHNLEFLLKRKDGLIIPMLVNLRMLHSNKGEYVGTLGAFTDITNQKKAEQVLKDSEARFKSMFESHDAIMLLIEPNTGVIIDANKAATKFYGYSKSTLCSFKIDDLNMLSSEQIAIERKKAINEECNYFIFPHKIANGTIRTVEIHTSPIKYKYSYLLFSIIHDITDRKNSENELIKAKKLLNETGKMAKVGGWEIDINGNTVVWTDETFRIYELSSDYAPNVSDAIKYYHPYDKEMVSSIVEKAVSEGSSFDFEARLITNKKNQIWVRASGKPVFENGELVGLIGSIQDITQKKHAEIELLKVNSDKDKFISILAHDLKNPFNSMLGFSQVLSRNIHKYDIDKMEKHVNIINETAINTYQMLENILAWSQAESGKIVFDPSVFRIKEICTSIMNQLNIQVLSKKITLECNMSDKLNVFTDINLLTTVMRNLVSNALKFTNNEGVITVDAKEVGDEIIVSVKDTGIGIEKEVLPEIFNVVNSITTLGTEYEKGTGLGLQICNEFVEIMGGKIWVESEVGVGSVFYYTIPKQIDID